MIDAEELYYRLLEVVKSEDFALSDEADEALSDAARAVVKGHEEDEDVILEGAIRGPNAVYSMYSAAGNDMVAERVSHLLEGCRKGVITRLELPTAVESMRHDIAKTHGEVYDTEPREAIYDALDRVCDELGWKSLEEF